MRKLLSGGVGQTQRSSGGRAVAAAAAVAMVVEGAGGSLNHAAAAPAQCDWPYAWQVGVFGGVFVRGRFVVLGRSVCCLGVLFSFFCALLFLLSFVQQQASMSITTLNHNQHQQPYLLLFLHQPGSTFWASDKRIKQRSLLLWRWTLRVLMDEQDYALEDNPQQVVTVKWGGGGGFGKMGC
jgi:hypothetical protein